MNRLAKLMAFLWQQHRYKLLLSMVVIAVMLLGYGYLSIKTQRIARAFEEFIALGALPEASLLSLDTHYGLVASVKAEYRLPPAVTHKQLYGHYCHFMAAQRGNGWVEADLTEQTEPWYSTCQDPWRNVGKDFFVFHFCNGSQKSYLLSWYRTDGLAAPVDHKFKVRLFWKWGTPACQ